MRIIKKSIISSFLLWSVLGVSQVVGINTDRPSSILEVNSKSSNIRDYVFKIQNGSLNGARDILSIRNDGLGGGIGRLSENVGFGGISSVLTLHYNGSEDIMKISVPKINNGLSTIRFSVSGNGGDIGEYGYRVANGLASMGLYGFNGHSAQIGTNSDQAVSVSSGNDEESGLGAVSERRIEFRSVLGKGTRDRKLESIRVDDRGRWSIGTISDAKKERLNMSKGLQINTPITLYDGIVHNGLSPVPRGGAGTVVFQESDNKLYGWNGKKWKQLSN